MVLLITNYWYYDFEISLLYWTVLVNLVFMKLYIRRVNNK